MAGPWRLRRSTSTNRILLMAFFEILRSLLVVLLCPDYVGCGRARFLLNWSSFLLPRCSISCWTCGLAEAGIGSWSSQFFPCDLIGISHWELRRWWDLVYIQQGAEYGTQARDYFATYISRELRSHVRQQAPDRRAYGVVLSRMEYRVPVRGFPSTT